MLHWIIDLGAPVALISQIVRGRGMHSTNTTSDVRDRHIVG